MKMNREHLFSFISLFFVVKLSFTNQSEIKNSRPPVEKRTFNSKSIDGLISPLYHMFKDESVFIISLIYIYIYLMNINLYCLFIIIL